MTILNYKYENCNKMPSDTETLNRLIVKTFNSRSFRSKILSESARVLNEMRGSDFSIKALAIEENYFPEACIKDRRLFVTLFNVYIVERFPECRFQFVDLGAAGFGFVFRYTRQTEF